MTGLLNRYWEICETATPHKHAQVVQPDRREDHIGILDLARTDFTGQL